MIIAPPASHAPFTPAPRHGGEFTNVTALRTPSFNYTSPDVKCINFNLAVNLRVIYRNIGWLGCRRIVFQLMYQF